MKKGADITIVTGHFGSGKTEISINLALESRKTNTMTAIADLDIVNPYYRARDARDLFYQHEIELIAPAERLAAADLPIVPGNLGRVICAPEYKLIVDAGGDKDGATALGQFYNDWKDMKLEVLFILNANRPYVSTLEGAAETLQKIEGASRLKITGIINNTNVGSETTIQDIEKGLMLSRQLSDQLGIPFLKSMVPRHLSAESASIRSESSVEVITRYLKLPWEM